MPGIKSQRLANKAKAYIAAHACMPYTPSLEGLPTWMSNFALEVTADLKAENERLEKRVATMEAALRSGLHCTCSVDQCDACAKEFKEALTPQEEKDGD